MKLQLVKKTDFGTFGALNTGAFELFSTCKSCEWFKASKWKSYVGNKVSHKNSRVVSRHLRFLRKILDIKYS